MKKNSFSVNWWFYLLFCASLALNWFFHKDSERFIGRDELWSDRAGYYIYLPATFFYHFDTRKMPADLDVQTGGGFSIDTLNNKIDTKYTCGTAMMAAPFFTVSGIVSRIAGYDSENGFSMIYMRMLNLAAIVYLFLGLWFLKKFLDHYFRSYIGLIVITMIYLGTNLFYYALIDGMMSHVYSFFLFALFLFALKRFLVSQSFSYFILLCIAFSLAVLVRPTSIMIGLLFFTWDAGTPAEWFRRLKQFIKPSYILPFFAILFIVFLPQLVYWKYLSGNWIHFSYTSEGFTNWRHPRIIEVLFSPVNGLFAYTPLAGFFVAGIVWMIIQRRPNGWMIAVLFSLVTLVCSTWNMWYFGCSYGQRSFIEYYAIFAVPFGWIVSSILGNRFFLVKTMLLFLIFLMVYSNLRYTVARYRYDRCYYGSTWDWDHYRQSFQRAGILSPISRIGSYENDFENLALSPVVKPSVIFTRSGQYSIAASEKDGLTPLYSLNLDELGYPSPKTMEVSLWVLKHGKRPTSAFLGYNLMKGDDILFADELPIDRVAGGTGSWMEMRKSFIVPDVNDSSLVINLFIRNLHRASIYVDDLRIKYNYKWN